MVAAWLRSVRRMYKVLIVVALTDSCNRFVKHLSAPFYRSMVVCSDTHHARNHTHGHKHHTHDEELVHLESQPGRRHGHHLHAVVEHGCAEIRRPHHDWSGSDHCAVRTRVVNSEVHAAGEIAMAQKVGFLTLPLFFAGPLMDVWGRKPVILMALVGFIMQIGFFTGAAVWYGGDGLGRQMPWLLPAGFFAGTAGAFDPAAAAMVTDLSAATADERSAALSMMMVIHHISHMVGIGSSIAVIKMRFGDYAMVWTGVVAFVLGLFLLTLVLLRESLGACPELTERTQGINCQNHHELSAAGEFGILTRGESSRREQFRRCFERLPLCGKCAEAARELWSDPFLWQFLLVRFSEALGATIAHAVAEPFLVGHLGYSMQVAAMGILFLPLAMASGSLVYWALEPRLGPHTLFGGGVLAIAVGFGVCGLSGPCSEWSDALFWGGLFVACLGAGVNDPAAYVIVSLRTASDTMGVIFAFLHALGTLGGLAGQMLTTQVLFDARARGFKAGLPFFVSSGSLMVSFLWFLLAYWHMRHRRSDEGCHVEEISSEESTNSGTTSSDA